MMREALIAAIEEFASQRYANYPAEKGAAFHSELFMLSGGLADAILALPVGGGVECHGLDTPERVCFYEQDFYVLSNFSAFTLIWEGLRFDTLEAAYHWEKFRAYSFVPARIEVQEAIRLAPSAHEAFKIAQEEKFRRVPDWEDIKVYTMACLLRAKVDQHEYVRRKLLATGDRELVENSWRDDFWGWGPNGDGQNMLGKLWMDVRSELQAEAALSPRSADGEKT